MKKIIVVFTLLFGSVVNYAQTPSNEWENPQILDKGKETGRSSFLLFRSHF